MVQRKLYLVPCKHCHIIIERQGQAHSCLFFFCSYQTGPESEPRSKEFIEMMREVVEGLYKVIVVEEDGTEIELVL